MADLVDAEPGRCRRTLPAPASHRGRGTAVFVAVAAVAAILLTALAGFTFAGGRRPGTR